MDTTGQKIITFFVIIITFKIAYSSDYQKDAQFKRIAYYSRWQLQNDLTPDKVNATLFTHLIYAFSTIKDDAMVIGDPNDPKRFQDLMGLKEKQPSLKMLISLACGQGDKALSEIVSDAGRRAKLVNSTVLFLKKYAFDGLDIDWEFPAWGGNPLSDKENFILLLKELRETFDQEPSPFLLTAAVSASWTIIIPAYDIKEMNKYLDFINLMTYDFHSYNWYEPMTDHNSPLFKRKIEVLIWATMNTEWSANFWVKEGMNKSKVLVGLPTYGYSYILADPKLHGFLAPALSGNGTHSYPQNCQFVTNGATRVFDDQSKVPYAYKDNIWLGYDDEESFTNKCNWVKQEQFGGVFTWDLNQDDWNQECTQQFFPLHTVIYNVLS